MKESKLITIEDERPSLEKVQELVGGLVELITLKNGDQMLFNENGIMADLEINEYATHMAIIMSNAFIYDGIRGNAVILKGKAKWD